MKYRNENSTWNKDSTMKRKVCALAANRLMKPTELHHLQRAVIWSWGHRPNTLTPRQQFSLLKTVWTKSCLSPESSHGLSDSLWGRLKVCLHSLPELLPHLWVSFSDHRSHRPSDLPLCCSRSPQSAWKDSLTISFTAGVNQQVLWLPPQQALVTFCL